MLFYKVLLEYMSPIVADFVVNKLQLKKCTIALQHIVEDIVLSLFL